MYLGIKLTDLGQNGVEIWMGLKGALHHGVQPIRWFNAKKLPVNLHKALSVDSTDSPFSDADRQPVPETVMESTGRGGSDYDSGGIASLEFSPTNKDLVT